MSATDVARWQFGITTLYHYIFIPVTLGLSLWSPAWKRCTPAPGIPPGGG